MDIVNPAIDRYLHELAHPEDPVLREMERLAAERSFPIVGPQVGRLLHLLARISGARRVLELGSGFGYSAYWFARAVGPAGTVVLTDRSAELADQAAAFLERGGLADRVKIVVGDSLDLVAEIGGQYDIVFNDVDKAHYPDVLERAASVLRPGGLLVSDNMLWFGTVLDDEPETDAARGVKELTRRLHESPRFETVLLPLRDGVTVSAYQP